MSFSFIPKEMKFFDAFDRAAAVINKAAAFFKETVRKGIFNEAAVQSLHDIEHECDEIIHDIIEMLNRTFITPFDREDIHILAKETDEVVDLLYTTCKRLNLYKLNYINNDLIMFSELIEQSVAYLAKALTGLREIKNHEEIQKSCIEINRIENWGDHLRDAIVESLLSDNNDAIMVIKWKEIFESAETVLDVCEDVANIIENILVKNA